MNGPTILTLFRIAMAPVWALVFVLFRDNNPPSVLLLIILWSLFFIMELSDILDGVWARKTKQVTDLGKVLDPFADVVSRVTAFYLLTDSGILPMPFFLLVLYRELGAVFLRLLFIKRGVAMAAGVGGKIKAWLYFLVTLVALMIFSTELWYGTDPSWDFLQWVNRILYILAGAVSLWSFALYIKIYIKALKEHPEKSEKK